MKRLILAAAALLLPVSAQAATYSLYGSSPPAGQPIRFTVNRSDVSTDATVVLSTKDNTALVNTDYQFSSVMVSFAKQQISATILIPTYVNVTKAGQTLKVGLIVSQNGTAVASMLASIVEPSAPPQTAWVAAPITELGYVRCKNANGCADQAKFGEVRTYAWNGIDAYNNIIGAYWPIDHCPKITKAPADWYLGIEGPISDWEGVARA
jgi:hypothetical protein